MVIINAIDLLQELQEVQDLNPEIFDKMRIECVLENDKTYDISHLRTIKLFNKIEIILI